MTIDLTGQVAIVTGAGGGLGRSHALALAARGAKVIVNDLGGDVHGEGGSLSAAQQVVEEIMAGGGDAIADGGNVTNETDMQAMADKAINAWGHIDILVNNAGVLRDKTFVKMDVSEFQFVLDVHLMGSVMATKAVVPHMIDRNYGRIVMTGSSSGLYGNFGQSNYGSAKMALVGLMNSLELELEKYNIRVNTLTPTAATRMTEGLMPDQVLEMLKPELVSPAVVFLASEGAPNGQILTSGAGCVARAAVVETKGRYFGPTPDADEIAAHWSENDDLSQATTGNNAGFQTMKFAELVMGVLNKS